jgi:alkylhydroperoxidase family enzyme
LHLNFLTFPRSGLGDAPDEVSKETRRHFSDKEFADPTLAIASINAWNRLLISARIVPGTYRPGEHLDKAAA